MLVYNYCGIIRIALAFHQVYILGDMSSNSLVRLDHVDQRDGTQHEQDLAKWAALSSTPLNVDFVRRVPIHHDLARDVLVKHPCQIKKFNKWFLEAGQKDVYFRIRAGRSRAPWTFAPTVSGPVRSLSLLSLVCSLLFQLTSATQRINLLLNKFTYSVS